jgi:hypothetical protein
VNRKHESKKLEMTEKTGKRKAQMKGECGYYPARLRVKVKLKAGPVHNYAPRFEDVWWSGGTIPRIICLGTRGVSGWLLAPTALLPGKGPPPDRRLGAMNSCLQLGCDGCGP